MYLSRPSEGVIESFIASQAKLDLTYSTIGCTREPDASNQVINGLVKDHNRIKLGEGQQCFERAKLAVKRWEMFNLGWVHIANPNASIETGTVACVVANSFGLWSLNACRIVYVINETDDGKQSRFGFGYGTLPGHAAKGEERFCVQWNHDDDSVWYDLLAYSSSQSLVAKLAYPVMRRFQKRFGRDSLRSMFRATSRPPKADMTS